MLSSLTLFAALGKKYPAASVTLIVSQTNYPVPYQEINPFVDEVLVYDKTSLKTILNFYYRLRKKKYDIGIVPSTIKLSRSSHIINFLSGAKVRVGVGSWDGKPNKSAYWLTVKGDFNWDTDKVHQSERNLDIAKLIGCSLTEEEKIIPLFTDETDEKIARVFISRYFPADTFLIGIHPGAGKKTNIWNGSNYIKVIENLNCDRKVGIVITYGDMDRPVVDKITAALKEKNIPFCLADHGPLELSAIISKLKLYITNDTGPMHIAAKTAVNQVSLFGPNPIYEWGPIGANKINIQNPSGNINDITCEEVTDASLSLINKFQS